MRKQRGLSEDQNLRRTMFVLTECRYSLTKTSEAELRENMTFVI